MTTDRNIHPILHDEAIRRIRMPGELGGLSASTRTHLQRLADKYEKLLLKFEAAEQALRAHQISHQKMELLPMNRNHFTDDEVQELNDGVFEACCEMEATEISYDSSLDQIEVGLQQEVVTDTQEYDNGR